MENRCELSSERRHQTELDFDLFEPQQYLTQGETVVALDSERYCVKVTGAVTIRVVNLYFN
jgi:hypothetical protein